MNTNGGDRSGNGRESGGALASLGFGGRRRVLGGGPAAGFFGAGWLLLGTAFAVFAVVYGDIAASPPGGPLVFVSFFYAVSLYAFSDFAVGRVAPALVGAARAAAWAVAWGVAAFYVASHAAAGEFGALALMAAAAVAVTALMLLARRIRNGRRRPGGAPPG